MTIAPMLTMGLIFPLSSAWSPALIASKGLPVASTPTRRVTNSAPLSNSAWSSKMGLTTLWMVNGLRQSPAQACFPSLPMT